MGEAAVFLPHRHTETHIAKPLPHAALIAGSALALAQRIGFGGFFGGYGGGGRKWGCGGKGRGGAPGGGSQPLPVGHGRRKAMARRLGANQ